VITRLKAVTLLGAFIWLAPAASASAQSLSYNSGQSVAPAYEGWEEDADGAKYFLFGYMNRNWEEEPDIPVGPGNNFSPALLTPASRRTSCPGAIVSSSGSRFLRAGPRRRS
jgi:hypothetical protein